LWTYHQILCSLNHPHRWKNNAPRRSKNQEKQRKTNTDKEKHVFICFVRLPVFVGFSLFLLVFELKIGGRRESQRLRVGELAREPTVAGRREKQ